MNTSTHTPKSRNRSWRAVAGMVMVAGLLATNVQAASADEGDFGASQVPGVVNAWATPRVNSQIKNFVRVKQLTNGSGGSLEVAIRGTGATYARTPTAAGGSWVTLRHDNGNYWVAAGTFYTNTEITGGCGGSGCGEVAWTGRIAWNILYN